MNDGPYWKSIIYKEAERCQKNWWTNFLFINNYINTDEQVNIIIYLYYFIKTNVHLYVLFSALFLLGI